MPRALPLILCSALVLTGCARLSDSRLNPSNWFASGGGGLFGGGTAETAGPLPELVPETARILVLDARRPVAEVTGLRLDRSSDGAILSATGRAEGAGWFNAELVLVSRDGGTAVYSLRAEAPRGAGTAGSTGSRTLTAAVALTTGDLAALRRIRVEAAGNSRAVSP